MNKLVFLLVLFLGFSAQAKTTTVETLVKCQQDDGDQWIEVGIGLNDGPGLRAYVVAHNDDDQSAKLVTSIVVTKSNSSGEVVFQDKFGTIQLAVADRGTFLEGSFKLLQDGPNSIVQDNLKCYEKLPMSFEN
ncbi:hypothetical protein ACES2L_15195 [Bdellovibrio bacteriovorus]